MLNWTGHPLMDVGTAVMLTFAHKTEPETLTEADLTAVADFIEREYVRQPLKAFLTVAFPNSGFTQPAFETQPARRLAYAQNVTRQFGPEVETTRERCVFTQQPTPNVIYNDKPDDALPPGRAFRHHVPMTLGVGAINFYPLGSPGLPVSAAAMLALQAFPLGCAKVGGRMLAVHADDPALTRFFAQQFLQDNLRAISFAQAEGSSKMPESLHTYRTLLIKELTRANSERITAEGDDRFISLTAYHLTNSGQGADLAIYPLPSPIVRFLAHVQNPAYASAWNAIVRRAWEQEPPKQRAKRREGDAPFQPRRNWLYEDIWRLPGSAFSFLRTYFLRFALPYARADQGDPRAAYSLAQEADLVSWPLTTLFLERIMNMDKERIEQIRRMGDALADYVADENDRRFFRNFATTPRYGDLRLLLIKANNEHVRRGHVPFLTFDNFLAVFEVGEEVPRVDWRLARDLLLIRMVERLHGQGWLGQHRDDLAAVAEKQEERLDDAEANSRDE